MLLTGRRSCLQTGRLTGCTLPCGPGHTCVLPAIRLVEQGENIVPPNPNPGHKRSLLNPWGGLKQVTGLAAAGGGRCQQRRQGQVEAHGGPWTAAGQAERGREGAANETS